MADTQQLVEDYFNEALTEVSTFKDAGKFYFNNEFDSNQSHFEYLSNQRVLCVRAPSEKEAKLMLVFVRAIYDREGDALGYFNDNYDIFCEDYQNPEDPNDMTYLFDQIHDTYEVETYETRKEVEKEQKKSLKRLMKFREKRRITSELRYDPYTLNIWTGKRIWNHLKHQMS
jgi:hypothetical protein